MGTDVPGQRAQLLLDHVFFFFASGRVSSYYSGEVLAPIGGETLPR